VSGDHRAVSQSIEVISGSTGMVTTTPPIGGSGFVPNDLVVPSDNSTLLFDGKDGP
jgi:hypothetical protein